MMLEASWRKPILLSVHTEVMSSTLLSVAIDARSSTPVPGASRTTRPAIAVTGRGEWQETPVQCLPTRVSQSSRPSRVAMFWSWRASFTAGFRHRCRRMRERLVLGCNRSRTGANHQSVAGTGGISRSTRQVSASAQEIRSGQATGEKDAPRRARRGSRLTRTITVSMTVRSRSLRRPRPRSSLRPSHESPSSVRA